MMTLASSSKHHLPTPPPSKRPRPTDEEDDDIHDEAESSFGSVTGNDAAAKAARKEARTIRNRESAQRSRNQRKAHLTFLETRVQELEAENRALKGLPPLTEPAFHTPPPDGTREPSPAQSVLSFANDLGIQPALLGGTGVSLASVAPPPADLVEDVKPIIAIVEDNKLESSTGGSFAALVAERDALKERVTLLEALVKQVVAVANLSGLEGAMSVSNLPIDLSAAVPVPSQEATATIDWSAFLSGSNDPLAFAPPRGLHSTLSPSFATLLPSENVSNPVACHPAAVATASAVSTPRQDASLQRARGIHSISSSMATVLMKDQKKMALLARLIVALARRRGWTETQHSDKTSTAFSPCMGLGMGMSRRRWMSAAAVKLNGKQKRIGMRR